MVRFKNRYFLCEICEFAPSLNLQALTPSLLSKEIKEAIAVNYGDMGSALISFSLQIKYLNNLSRIFIVRAARDHKNLIWTTLMTMDSLNGHNVHIRILNCSGTIKKTEHKARRILQRWVHKILQNKHVSQQVKTIMQEDYQKSIESLQQIEF